MKEYIVSLDAKNACCPLLMEVNENTFFTLQLMEEHGYFTMNWVEKSEIISFNKE